VRSVKFLAPLKPAQPFTISLFMTSKDAGEVTFWCRVEERVIVEGRLAVVWGAK